MTSNFQSGSSDPLGHVSDDQLLALNGALTAYMTERREREALTARRTQLAMELTHIEAAAGAMRTLLDTLRAAQQAGFPAAGHLLNIGPAAFAPAALSAPPVIEWTNPSVRAAASLPPTAPVVVPAPAADPAVLEWLTVGAPRASAAPTHADYEPSQAVAKDPDVFSDDEPLDLSLNWPGDDWPRSVALGNHGQCELTMLPDLHAVAISLEDYQAGQTDKVILALEPSRGENLARAGSTFGLITPGFRLTGVWMECVGTGIFERLHLEVEISRRASQADTSVSEWFESPL